MILNNALMLFWFPWNSYTEILSSKVLVLYTEYLRVEQGTKKPQKLVCTLLHVGLETIHVWIFLDPIEIGTTTMKSLD